MRPGHACGILKAYTVREGNARRDACLALVDMDRELATSRSRYTIEREIASGGMATVYAARLAGPGGFSRLVAIKRPHSHLARNPEFRAMLLDEGRLAASISHPNVVATLDVVAEEDDLLLVMEYVPGHTLAQLQQRMRACGSILPPPVACTIVRDVLMGLAAVHAARDERGYPLGIVHRDISPQNVLVGRDGVARILDFGVAKAAGRLQVTREGQLKGKVAYMAPEQTQGDATPRTDIYAASVVLWEALAGRRLFAGESEIETFSKVLTAVVEPPSRFGSAAPENGVDADAWARLDAVVLRGMAREPSARFASAGEMVAALDRCVAPWPAADVSAWLERTCAHGPEDAPDSPRAGTSAVTSIAEPRRTDERSSTLTSSGQNVLAVRVLGDREASADGPRASEDATTARRRGRLAAAGVVGAVAVLAALGSAYVAWTPRTARGGGSEEGKRELGPAASIAAGGAPAAVSAASSPAPTATTAPVPPATASTERVPPAPKSRVERSKRPAAVPPGVDLGHAIDARH